MQVAVGGVWVVEDLVDQSRRFLDWRPFGGCPVQFFKCLVGRRLFVSIRVVGAFVCHRLESRCYRLFSRLTRRRAAWYDKLSPTFVGAIDLVRRRLWLASEVFNFGHRP